MREASSFTTADSTTARQPVVTTNSPSVEALQLTAKVGGSPSDKYPLPQGWRRAVSKQGKPYFLNDTTKETTW